MYEEKLQRAELAEKIMAHQMLFISRFLDITPEDLCGYSKKQLRSMVDSTIEQMPEDLLRQFEIELEGGQREF